VENNSLQKSTSGTNKIHGSVQSNSCWAYINKRKDWMGQNDCREWKPLKFVQTNCEYVHGIIHKQRKLNIKEWAI